jgi:hypothetical protein
MKNITPEKEKKKIKKKPVKEKVKKIKKEEPKELTVVDSGEKKAISKKGNLKGLQLNDPSTLISKALENNVGVEQLNALMEMKYRHEDREAEKEFHHYFSLMQANLPVVKKKKVVDGAYMYAPLEDIIKEILPCLKEYGFSYRWTEEGLEQGWKRIHCHISGHGHTESSFIDIPPAPVNKYANVIQRVGISSTYGKRYSLLSALGIVMEDQDTDGNMPDDKERRNILAVIGENLKQLNITKMDEVRKKTGIKDFNTAAISELRKVSKTLKAEIENKKNKPEPKKEEAKPEKSMSDYLKEVEILNEKKGFDPSNVDILVNQECPNGVNIDGLKNVINKLNSMKKEK